MSESIFPPDLLPSDLSRYIYGTTRLGDEALPLAERIAIARRAMESGVWFHTSEQYGGALQVLGEAFDEDRQHVPKLIVKAGNDSIDDIRATLLRHTKALGVSRIDMAQLCLGGPLAEDFATGGKCYDGLRKLQDEGLVGHYVLEVFPWTSEMPLRTLRAGHADGLVGGCIFYFNPLQRFVANDLWDLIRERRVPILAMRTVAGGDVHRLRDVPGAAWKPYLQERAVEVAPIFERSKVSTWSEFCVRFAHSLSEVVTTVGSTSREDRLGEFLAASRSTEPLPSDIIDELLTLQRRWSVETDMQAEPWSM